MGNQRAECVKGDNCSFRHDTNKRGKKMKKSSPSNPSQNSFMQQNERKNIENPKSQRKKSQWGETSRWPCKDYLRGTCNNSFLWKMAPLQNACTTRPRVVVGLGEKCSFAHRQVDEQPTKRSKSNNDKSAVAILKKGNWQASVTNACHDRTGQPVKRSDEEIGTKFI